MSIKLKILISIIIGVIMHIPIHGQDDKPKVALVLSGGGAKGIAHIPLLQKLDSLGIVPDMVIGTSMGAVIGGLYAMGYSGDSIAAISQEINWSRILGGKVYLSKVGNEEKSEFGRYLLDLNWRKGKPEISGGILNDQNLRELFSLLTYPVYDIYDFDNLAIPYRAVATDIVEGKEVIIKNGSLSTAMRASMSIPTVFKPVNYNETLLVDGGVFNNFPTDIAKEMGADIIIGSDVGGGMKPKEELNNLATILFQTSMLISNVKNPENRKLCDILVDHTPYITYSTGDFNSSSGIYFEGKIATANQYKALEKLSDQLKGTEQRKHQLPKVAKEFKLDSILYTNISKGNLSLVKARTDFKTEVVYTPSDIESGVNRAMGTNLFNQIIISPKIKDSILSLKLEGIENSKNQVKLALHYDNYRGVGLITNFTARNLFTEASRTLISVDIAEQPKVRIQHQQIFGEKKMWWWRTDMLWQKLKQKIYIDGSSFEGIRYNSVQFENQFNRNINSLKTYVGVGATYNKTVLKPNPIINTADENISQLIDYKFNYFNVDGHFNYNTFEKGFYSTRGAFAHLTFSQSLIQKVKLKFSDDNDNISSSTNSFAKANFIYEKRIPVSNSITAIFGITAAFIFENDLKPGDVSFSDYGYAAKYFIGGNLTRPMRDTYVFKGLHEDELAATQFMTLNLAFQYSPIRNLYIKPHTSIASVGFGGFNDYLDQAFNPKGSWVAALDTSTLFSVGSTFSYDSLFGPVNLDVSWVNDIEKFRIFFGVGFHFGRTN